MGRTLGVLFLLAASGVASAGDLVPTDSRWGPLRLASHEVDVTVDNQLALTRTVQVFANDHPATLEAHYVFPIPKGASIIDFSMTIDGKVMRGELLEKQRARQVYEGIVRQAKDPGLLEHVGADIFRMRVFPILPKSEQKIELTYVERVNYDSGLCRYVYPLVTPGSREATLTDRFTFRLDLSSNVPLRHVESPSHAVEIARKDDSRATVSFGAERFPHSKDLEIEYRIEAPELGMDLVAHRTGAEEGTFVLLITPEVDVKESLPKDMTFVFDTSGSMEGDRIRQARAALRFCLSKLRPEDRFNILSFSGEVAAFRPQHVAATEEAKKSARTFIDALDATGSTNIDAALLRAMAHPVEPGRPHLVVFLTDGEPTAGETDRAQIVRNVMGARAEGVRIFAFGVGEQLNKVLLDELADATGAVSEFVAGDENIETKVSRLQKRIAAPIVTGLSLDWGGAEVRAVHPKAPGDLYAGTQLMVTGRYAQAGTFEVVLTGRAGDREVTVRKKVEFPEEREASKVVTYLWAMRNIASLLDDVKRHGENAEVVSTIIALSKRHRIATPYTSFLVLENEQAYDQHGIDRQGARWKPPEPSTVRRPDAGKPAPDPAFHKASEESDHNETADFVSDKPFQGGDVYDVIGGGGRFGGRLGGKRTLAARGGGGNDTEDAVLAALKWLARHQNPDGSWRAKDYGTECNKIPKYPGGSCRDDAGIDEADAGVTGLSLLAFLGAGYCHLSKDTYDGICFGDVVRLGLQWMMNHQGPDGCIGPRSAAKYMYNHAVCAMALSEAYGLTGSNLFKNQAQKAIDFLVSAPIDGRTGYWTVMALHSAKLAVLDLSKEALDRARSLADGIVEDGTLAALIFTGSDSSDPRLAEAADRIVANPPQWQEGSIDFPRWNVACLGLFQSDGPSGATWRAWGETLKESLTSHQNSSGEGCTSGSWEPAGPGCDEGGRIYATAINALTLEVYYRYPSSPRRK